MITITVVTLAAIVVRAINSRRLTRQAALAVSVHPLFEIITTEPPMNTTWADSLAGAK